MDLSVVDTFKTYSKVASDNKKILSLYFFLIVIITLSVMTVDNYMHPMMELAVFILSTILGIFCILYYFLHDNELHKVAFLIIICFGLIFAFLSPMFIISDEFEHFTRSEITSRGVLFPEYVVASDSYPSWDGHTHGFVTIQGIIDFTNNDGSTIFDTDFDTNPINYTSRMYHSAFMHNPFYGYLAQGFGMFIAKLLDLNVIWLLWLGRAFNLIMYAGLVSVAVKRTPILKVPFIVMASLPVVVMQASSMSIDSFINGMGFIAFAYFLFMLKSSNNSLDYKNVGIFSIFVILLGLCKLPYLAFIFLLLIVPKNKFKTPFYHNFIFIICVIIVGVLWSRLYAVPTYFNSFRGDIPGIGIDGQISYMSGHLLESFVSIAQIPNYLGTLLYCLFMYSYSPFEYNSGFLMAFGFLFLGAIIFLYPSKINISKKSKLGMLIIAVLIFFGTFIIQLLSWTPIGKIQEILGVNTRYFIPLLPMLPIILGINNHNPDKHIDGYIVMSVVLLLVASVILTAVVFY